MKLGTLNSFCALGCKKNQFDCSTMGRAGLICLCVIGCGHDPVECSRIRFGTLNCICPYTVLYRRNEFCE